MQEIIQQIRRELRGTWRFRWVAMAVAWAICVVGWIMVMRMPDVYQASARVYVDADSRLADVVGQVGVAPGVGSRVFVVRQAMLGTPQLERVARESDLDLRATTEDEKAGLIASLRDRISVSTGRTSQSRNLFTITFEDNDRQMAIRVVETLLNAFVEDVLELKDKGAQEVTGYLEDQLAHYSGLLSESEAQLADFKQRHVGLLPGENGGIFEKMQAEMELLKQLRLDLRIQIDRRDELRRQLDVNNPMLPDGSDGSGVGVTSSPTELAISGLETRRADLLLTFTERHPDIVAIDEQLEQLYAKRRAEIDALRNSGLGMEGAANATNPVYQTAQIQLNEASVSIAAIQSQIREREGLVRQLNNDINTIPEIEAEYTQLTRNYDQYRSLYNELLLQRERERLGAVGEDRDVVNFNVVQPPDAAFEPSAPQRGILIMMVLMAGLAVGAGVAFLVHQFKPVFHDAETLRRIAGRPVLGVVSMTWLERKRATRRVDVSTFALAASGLFVLFIITIAFQDAGVALMQNLASATHS